MRIACFLLGCSLAIGCDLSPSREAPTAVLEAPETVVSSDGFVSPGSCAGCHPAEQAAWVGSHHDRAMEVAGPDTVLGDFDDAEFVHHGAVTHFRRRDGRYLVETDGPDDKRREFEVAYTFGVEPLQQYLIAFPGGRLQALTIAWDTERKRWFSLYPDEAIAASDPLHWTGRLQRWNMMCADCHSTALVRGYDVASATYKTEYAALNVACQACHGPGAAHVDWARSLDSESVPTGADPLLSVRLADAPAEREIETCAPCHSRRHAVSERVVPGEPLLDHYAPELLRSDLYHADGQIDGEVYVYGSFVQSLMARRGVRCSDCHEPHGLGLRAEGNALCTRCHSPQPDPRFEGLARRVYDSPEHHFHPDGSPGARCVSCHMPSQTYMQVDDRRDHSLRIPRPDLSLSIGTPNACTGCHAERDARWAADLLAARREEKSLPVHYGEALAAARARQVGAVTQLLALVGRADEPGIARATALEMLVAHGADPRVADVVLSAASDSDAIVRAAAASALAGVDPARAAAVLAELSADERRAVRVEAARVLAGMPQDGLTTGQREAFRAALDEYRSQQLALGDTAEAHLNLGVVDQWRERTARAEDAYRTALQLQPEFVPAHVNLANLLNQQGRNAEAEAELRAALATHAASVAGLDAHPLAQVERGEIHYSLGLLLAETGKLDAAEQELGEAAELLPDRPRIRYNLGLALQQLGRRAEALAQLREAEALAPAEPSTQNALAIFYAQEGDRQRAIQHAERLVEITRGAPPALELLGRLRDLPVR